MPVVSDSSPLISLSAIGRFELLHQIYDEVYIPPAVWQETAVDGAGRAGASALAQSPWVVLQPLLEPGLAQSRFPMLDAGEAEAIALALSRYPGLTVILDDLRARRIAERADLSVTGTAGVIVLAKQLGLIHSAASVLGELVSAGHYLGKRALQELLSEANEL
jgi:predicted nucleic acid-binding protein